MAFHFVQRKSFSLLGPLVEHGHQLGAAPSADDLLIKVIDHGYHKLCAVCGPHQDVFATRLLQQWHSAEEVVRPWIPETTNTSGKSRAKVKVSKPTNPVELLISLKHGQETFDYFAPSQKALCQSFTRAFACLRQLLTSIEADPSNLTEHQARHAALRGTLEPWWQVHQLRVGMAVGPACRAGPCRAGPPAGTAETPSDDQSGRRSGPARQAGPTVGMVMSSSLHNAQGCTGLRRLLLDHCKLRVLVKFDNEMRVFSGVHSQFKFDIVVFEKRGPTEGVDAAFFSRETENALQQFRSHRSHLRLPAADVRKLSPQTLTLFEFRRRATFVERAAAAGGLSPEEGVLTPKMAQHVLRAKAEREAKWQRAMQLWK